MEPGDCLTQADGTIMVAGLEGRLRILRDRWGIPHVQAGSSRDAFFAQGFCLGQERLFQLELFRQMAHGRAAALLNAGLLRLDRMNRRLGYGRAAAAEWEAQSPQARMILQAYADGVNAARAAGPAPYEFHLLDHVMAPWSPADSLAILKMVSSGTHWSAKLAFGRVAAALGPDAAAAMLPGQEPGNALIVPAGARWGQGAQPYAEALRELEAAPPGVRSAADGSNCWVLAGSRTRDGAPIVCGDPHLPLSVPGQWYVMHMECPEFTVAGPCSPGYPGPVYYGHNTQVAWTMTHAMGDRWDLYRERIRPGAEPAAEFQGGWEPLRRIPERFTVRDGDDAEDTIWLTRHGPVIDGDPTRDDEVIAARWGLHEPAHDFDALLPLFTSRSVDAARAAFRRYDSISGNFCFADPAGNIAYQYTGRLPNRPPYLTPVPGWDGDHEWRGSVPKEELPADENPPGGLLVTANNRTAAPAYPHYLSFLHTPFRADRLREVLGARKVWAPEDLETVQADRGSLHARGIVDRIAAVPMRAEGALRLQDLLRGWDCQLDADSPAALAFLEACEQLSRRTVRRFFAGTAAVPAGTAEERRILYEQMQRDAGLMLPEGTTWADCMEAALAEAWAALSARSGDPARWRYGAMHQVAWRHNLGRDPQWAPLLNLGDVEIGGDDYTPNNAQTIYGKPGDHGVSYRQILNLADLNAARICIVPGNSGQPGSPHYGDGVERWRAVQYHPLYIDWPDIQANAEAELTLDPG